MIIQPVYSYRSPNIPTRDYVDDNPEILNHIPRRWMSDAAVLTALAGTVILISSCKSNTPHKSTQVSKVAPIFKHGEGISSFGCIAINPPVVLDEAEAREIIKQEALKSGLLLEPTRSSTVEYPIPQSSTILKRRFRYEFTTVHLDGVDKKKRIYYKYISESSAMKLSPPDNFRSTAYGLDTKQIATTLRNELSGTKHNGTYGVFYDPLVSTDLDKYSSYKLAERSATQQSKQLLRAQVKDFIKWLKTEGVI